MSDSVLFVGSWLLTFLLHSTVWLGGAWLALRWLSSASPAAREWIWKGATIGALLSPTLQLTAPQWFQIDGLGGRFTLGGATAAVAPSSSPPPYSRFQLSSATIRSAPSAGASPILLLMALTQQPETVGSIPLAGGTWPQDLPAPTPTEATLTATAAFNSATAAPSWLHLLMGLWVAGAVGGVGLWGWRLFALKRHLKNRRPLSSGPLLQNVQNELARFGEKGQRVHLSISERIHVPVAFGLLRGEVCLPVRALKDLDAAHQCSMIGHELAHLRRRDPLWITFFNIVQRVLFFQPLLLIARREVMHAAEELCDSWACDGTGDRFAMAECLTKVATWLHAEKRDLPVACMVQPASPLQRRIERLLNHQAVPLNQARAGRAAFLWVALMLAMALAAPGVASHFTPTEGQTVTLSVDLLGADLELAQARIQFLQTEIAALEQEFTSMNPNLSGMDEIRRTLDYLRQQLSLLQRVTLEISRDSPANLES